MGPIRSLDTPLPDTPSARCATARALARIQAVPAAIDPRLLADITSEENGDIRIGKVKT